jgi:L-aspartate oxidase
MGGVVTDLDGRTSVPGLFAAGEVACTGVHGANRLASNSLLEGLVFGARAARAMMERRGARRPAVGSCRPGPQRDVTFATEDVRSLMWQNVGLFRERRSLRTAVASLEARWEPLDRHLREGGRLDFAGWRAANLLTVARLIARAAERREESRGAHYRDDFPERDDVKWKRRIVDCRLRIAE